jgi:hypothetical protein
MEKTLPQLPTQLLELSPDIRNAYPIILRFEESARTHSDSKTRSTLSIYARILGYLLLYGPSNEARKTVTNEVVSCATKDALEDTGKLYFDRYIRACKLVLFHVGRHSKDNLTVKKVNGRTPTLSSHPSRYSFDDVQQLKGKTLKQPPQDHSVAKRRVSHSCHSRKSTTILLFLRPCPGYRCVVTGHYDAPSVQLRPNLEEMAAADGGTVTQCAHIFDASTNEKLADQGGDTVHFSTLFGMYPYYRRRDITLHPCGPSWIGLAIRILLKT